MIKARSFVLSASFPSSKTGMDGMKAALEQLAPWGIDTIEYYVSGVSPEDIGTLLQGKQSIFLAGARQKMENLNPSSPDRGIRESAIAGLKECFHFARRAGASAVMISSGVRPDDEKKDSECIEILAESLSRLHKMEPDMPVLLESGDRDVEYRHLLGPTSWTVDFALRCRSQGIPLGLVFDISHIAQLGENPEEAWNKARAVCNHVHFANCVLDKKSPIYGDKHPFFGIPGGVYTHNDAQNFLALLKNEENAITISLEIICPTGENERAFFNSITAAHSWFFAG